LSNARKKRRNLALDGELPLLPPPAVAVLLLLLPLLLLLLSVGAVAAEVVEVVLILWLPVEAPHEDAVAHVDVAVYADVAAVVLPPAAAMLLVARRFQFSLLTLVKDLRERDSDMTERCTR
jgi:hypothetical protein